MEIDGFDALEWLDAPPAAAAAQAESLLRQLGAEGAIGREMARYPLHPRLARLIVEARRRGVAEDGCTVAALLSAGERLPAEARHAGRSDLLALLEAPWEPRTEQVVRQVRRIVNPPKQAAPRRGRAADFGAGRVSRSRGAPPRRAATCNWPPAAPRNSRHRVP